MKRVLMFLTFVVVVLAFLACSEVIFGREITFEEVSQPYLDQYGSPEETSEYKSDDYHSIDWWWWSKGFMVNFLNTTYDDVNGWTVDHTYSFDPI